jgi:enterochelin esterase family protein
MHSVTYVATAILSGFFLLPSPAPLVAQNLAGDEALSKVLLDGEDWQLVAEGFGFTDGACADAEGNFYFMDLGKGTAIQKISPDGKVTDFIKNAPKCSGLKFGPDGRLYACTQGPKKQLVAIEVPSGNLTVLADNVQPNDLVVSHKGYAYFTETGKGQVTIVDGKGNVRVGATGINAPNGITLSPDQGTLAVSEYRGTNVWVYRVNADGGLDAGARYMTLRTPVGKADSGGDGSTTDSLGRYYVTSHLGIQMFDSTGRMGGIITKPTSKGCVSVAFAGTGHEYLYACASDKIFRRKTKAKGALFFKAPVAAESK